MVGPLSTEQIRRHLARVTYKPGWSFEAYDGRWEGQHIVITAPLPDSYREGETVTLRIESMLPPMSDTRQLEEWLMWRLARIEVHEAREFFKVDGQVRFDPHAPFAERDLPAFGEAA